MAQQGLSPPVSAEFAHIGFLTLGEAQRLLALLAPGQGDVVVDVACGTGGPGLPASSVDALMSIEAFQYAPDKRAGLTEFARVLQPGGRLGLVCFEVDPTKTPGIPVVGADPVPDYRPVLESAGFDFVALTKPQAGPSA